VQRINKQTTNQTTPKGRHGGYSPKKVEDENHSDGHR